MKPPKILFISNGHGEDLLASVVIQSLRTQCPVSVSAYPVVGLGNAYARADIEVIGVQQTMPTGGFILKGPGNLLKDLRAGLLSLTLRQIKDLRARRDDFDAVVAVGDIYALLLAGRYVRKPMVFVPTAKSQYISGHYKWEYALMKRYAQMVFPRDEPTHQAMQQHGVPSAYVGNLMMDALDVSGDTFGLSPDDTVITMLPGSREDAALNVCDLLDVAVELDALRPGVRFLLSVAPQLDGLTIVKEAGGWHFVPVVPGQFAGDRETSGHNDPGLIGRLVRDDHGRIPERGDHGRLEVLCVQGKFGDLLQSADVVVGLAGTGNEQAVGLGKPLVAFVGRGTQYTAKFASDQKLLLGDAMSLVERDPKIVAAEVVSILDDRDKYRLMAETGRQRMGPPGAARRMAQGIIDCFRRLGLL